VMARRRALDRFAFPRSRAPEMPPERVAWVRAEDRVRAAAGMARGS